MVRFLEMDRLLKYINGKGRSALLLFSSICALFSNRYRLAIFYQKYSALIFRGVPPLRISFMALSIIFCFAFYLPIKNE